MKEIIKIDRQHYTGIGSRKTPKHIADLMTEFAYLMALKGLCLRSGGADGADDAFERGVIKAQQEHNKGLMEIFLPYAGFNGRPRNHPDYINKPLPAASKIAQRFHMHYRALKPTVKLLMDRNAHQVFGRELDSKCRFIICWTPDGSIDGISRSAGGTGMALRAGYWHDIPIYNLQRVEHRNKVKQWIESTRLELGLQPLAQIA